jgi:hypothetical protein
MSDINIKAKITTDTADSTKKVRDLKDGVNDLGKNLDKSTKSSKGAGGAFGQLKTVITGLGIVTIIQKGFELFSGALMKNQKVADTVATVMTTIENVFSAVVGVITNVIKSVSDSSNGFEHLGKVVGGILTLSLTPLKLTFFAIKLVIQEAQLAWEKSFFGGNDNDKIAELNKNITETQTAIVETGKKAVGAGVDIVKNIGGAVNEVGQVVSKTYDGVSKISVKAIYEQSKATIELKNNAKLAEATLEGVLKKYNTQAEKLRQIRDDDKLSIEDRIKANNELGEVLKKRQSIALALAEKSIAAAQADLNANKGNIDLQAALIRAQNARLDVLDEIAGMESEQKMNSNALTREQIALTKTQAENEAKLGFDKEKQAASFIENELLRNQTLQQIRDKERASEVKRLQDNVNQFAAGTQARIDAEVALKQKISELDAADDQAKIEREKIILKRQQDNNTATLANNVQFIQLKKALLETEKMDAFSKAKFAMDLARQESQSQIDAINAKRDAEILAAEKAGLDTTAIKQNYATQVDIINAGIAKSEKDLAKAKIEATTQAADAAAASLNSLSQLMGEATGAGKALAVASTTISTFTAAQKAYESTIGIPFVGPVLAPINAALAVASGIMQVKKILAVQVPGAGGGSLPSGASLPAPIAPQQASTQLNAASIQGIGNAAAGGVNRAFVVSSDNVSADEQQRRLQRAARLG